MGIVIAASSAAAGVVVVSAVSASGLKACAAAEDLVPEDAAAVEGNEPEFLRGACLHRDEAPELL